MPVGIAAATGAPRCFPITLAQDDFAQLSLPQDSDDLTIEIRSPRGSVIARVDAFEYGLERASLIASEAGVFRFCVSPTDSAKQTPALYKAEFAGPRAAQPGDRARVDAERGSTELRRLSQGPDAQDRRRAIEEGQRILDLWESLGETGARVSVLIEIGDALNALGEYQAAIDRYQQALQINPPGELRPAVEATSNSGVAYLRLGDIEAATHAYERSLALAHDLNNPFLIAAIENNRANLFGQIGEFQRALDAYFAALPGMRSADNRSRGVLLSNIGLAYASVGEYARGEAWLQRSLALLSAPGNRVAKAVALMNLGRVRALSGNLKGAVPPLQYALALVGSTSPRDRGDVLNNLGQVLYRKGEMRAAVPVLTDAIDIFRRMHNTRGLSGATHYLGVVRAQLGDFDGGLAALRESLELRLAARLEDDAVATLLEMARIERRRGNAATAQADLERAMAMIEKLRVHIAAPDLRATWFVSRRAVHEEMLYLLFDSQPANSPQGFAARGLEVAERARSRSWLDELGGKRYETLHAFSPGLADREQKLARNLVFKSRQLSLLPASADFASKRTALSGEVDELDLQYESLASEIAARRPETAGLDAAAAGADGFRKLMADDTVLIEYALGETSSYVWSVTPEEIKWYRLPSRRVIESLARPVAELAGGRRERLANPGLETRYRAANRRLGRMLLGPVAASIPGKRIVFSLDGILHSVPFAALPAPDCPGVPLGIAHEISRIASASMLAALRAKQPPPANGPIRIALLADPVFAGDPRAGGQDQKSGGAPLPRLPFSLREAQFIERAAHGATIVRRVGFDAAKSALAEDAVRRSTILHFATHARIDATKPELSGIFLAQVDRNGSVRDGLLSLYEIYDLHLPVELAVLSGCSTGLGRAVPGDGFVGLTKAFFYAGAARVLVSLWAVDDEGTALFMRAFYSDLLKAGEPSPDRALRSAREALWRNPRWRDPAYWSGFSLEGEWRPLSAGRPAA